MIFTQVVALMWLFSVPPLRWYHILIATGVDLLGLVLTLIADWLED